MGDNGFDGYVELECSDEGATVPTRVLTLK